MWFKKKKKPEKKSGYKDAIRWATEQEKKEKRFCSCCEMYAYLWDIGTGTCGHHGEYAGSKEICPKFKFSQNSYNRYVSFGE